LAELEVCDICYKFLESIYDKKKMKNIRRIIVVDKEKLPTGIKDCRSMYHKKLTDSFKS
jgi:hypothetical protein